MQQNKHSTKNLDITFYSKICEIIKIEATIFSILVVAFSFILNAILGFNRLAFDLAQAKGHVLPNAFIPYGPIIIKFTLFGGIGLISLLFGIVAIYIDGKYQKILGFISIFLFFVSILIFGYAIYSYRLSFFY